MKKKTQACVLAFEQTVVRISHRIVPSFHPCWWTLKPADGSMQDWNISMAHKVHQISIFISFTLWEAEILIQTTEKRPLPYRGY